MNEAAQGWGTNEAKFVEILSKASVEQIDLIEASYEGQFGKSLKATIEGEMGGDLEFAMLLRLETPLDASCRLLRHAMDGAGTNEDTIARVRISLPMVFEHHHPSSPLNSATRNICVGFIF